MKVPEKNRLEWAVFFASLVIIGAVIGTLVVFEVSRPDTPPDLQVRTSAVRQSGNGYAVGVLVDNRGGRAAASVHVEVVLGDGSGGERSELTLPYVPHGSTRSGEVMFTHAPRPGVMRARVLGYEIP
jgi:uncharacterized protein (TIGR02588 family)